MKKILIAIDYSPTARKVAEQGYALGKAMNAEIVLLHVIEYVGYYSSTVYDPIMGFVGFSNTNFLGSDVVDSITKESTIYLEKIKLHLQDNAIKTAVSHGQIADTILETARTLNCKLIVVGTHSKSIMGEIIMGSTAHKLIKHSTVPILIIPIKAK